MNETQTAIAAAQDELYRLTVASSLPMFASVQESALLDWIAVNGWRVEIKSIRCQQFGHAEWFVFISDSVFEWARRQHSDRYLALLQALIQVLTAVFH
jgi:hypothetical protein